jgi:hypothetical protein
MTAFDKDNLHIIFSNLVTWWLHKFNYGQNIIKLGKSLVAATLDVYEQVQQQLLPTPTKSHYTFNLRDVSKVFQVCHQACPPLPTFFGMDHGASGNNTPYSSFIGRSVTIWPNIKSWWLGVPGGAAGHDQGCWLP